MKRREIAGTLLAGAVVATVATKRSEAQTCSIPCYPQTPAEVTAGVTPTNTQYPPNDVRRYGAVGNGSTDDGPAFNKALLCASEATGTGIMKVVYAPKPQGKYLINTAIVNQSGVALDYNGEDISSASTQAQTLPLYQQLSIEGVPPLNYKTAVAYAITMDPGNGSLAAPYRYWSVVGAVGIPSTTSIAAGTVTSDSVGVRGQATNSALNGRIWGVVGVAQSNCAATSDANIGSMIGGEFDVNNDTGLNYTDYDRNVNICSIQIACGGTANAMAGIDMQVNPSTVQFVAGIVSKQQSIAKYGWYLDNVAPTNGVIYVSDAYTGGPAVCVKNGTDGLYLRSAIGSTDYAGRVTSSGTAMGFINGMTGQYWANHANTTELAFLTDAGTFGHYRSANSMSTNSASGTITDLATPTGIILLTNASQVTNLNAGEVVGQEVVLYFANATGCIAVNGNASGGSQMILAGHSNMAATQFSTLTLFYDGASWIEKSRSVH